MMTMTALVATGRLWTSFTPARCLSQSGPLSARAVKHIMHGLNLREEELQNFNEDEIDSMLQPDMEDLQNYASQIDVDAKNLQTHVRRKTVEQKYFKQNQPTEKSLLTWAMKEQMCYLHSTDPESWAPEVLAQAFPISAAGAKRLLKAKWVPKNEAAIQRHDKAVMAHWKLHMKGQLGSDKLVKQIIQKGSMVTLPVPVSGTDQILSTLESLKFDNDEKPYTPVALKPKNKHPRAPRMKTGSFSSIIKDYESQVSQLNKKHEEDPKDTASSAPSRCQDLSAIVSGTPQYEGNYSQVSFSAAYRPQVKGGKKSKKRQLLTLSEFMKQKSS